MTQQQYQVQAILAKKYEKLHEDETLNLQYLVKWRTYPFGQATWQPLQNLKNSADLIYNFEDRIANQRWFLHENSYICAQNWRHASYLRKLVVSTERRRLIKRGLLERVPSKNSFTRKKSKSDPSRYDTIDILYTMYNGSHRTYKIKEDGHVFEVDRDYLIEKYPRQLCNFYEKMVVSQMREHKRKEINPM